MKIDSELNKICLKYKCWIDSFGYVRTLSPEKPIKLGKVYFKSSLYHVEDTSGKHFCGDTDFEIALLKLLKSIGYV